MEQLFCLKTFAEQNKTENLENALKELRNNPVLTAGESTSEGRADFYFEKKSVTSSTPFHTFPFMLKPSLSSLVVS